MASSEEIVNQKKVNRLRCSVSYCRKKNDAENGKRISFHKVPANKTIAKKWIKFCKRTDDWNPKAAKICSRHFLPSDFITTGQASKPQLVPNAVPSITKIKEDTENIRDIRQKKRERKKIIDELLAAAAKEDNSVTKTVTNNKKNDNSLPASKDNNSVIITVTENNKNDISLPATKNNNNSVTRTVTGICFNNDKSLYNALATDKTTNEKALPSVIHVIEPDLYDTLIKKDNEISFLQKKMMEKNKEIFDLNLKVKAYEYLFEQMQIKSNSDFEKRFKETVLPMISSDQADIMLKKKKMVQWKKEDIAKAFIIRMFNVKCYKFLKRMNYPLPSLQSLRNWATKIYKSNGILTDIILLMMKISGRILKKQEKICIIQFAEMKCREKYEYDAKNDEVVGPHKYMQYIEVRGLFSSWKQTVYVDFDVAVTDTILLQIISELDKIGFSVVGCVCDLGVRNQKLFNSMNISYNGKCFFLHPITKKKVFVFPDTPHLLKLIRNWLINTGFALSDGTIIQIHPIQELIDNNIEEIDTSYHLTQNHIIDQESEKENVSLAIQLLSDTTSICLREYINTNDAVNLADFIEITHNWYNVMNSCNINEEDILKKPFGTHFEIQNQALQSMYDMIIESRCIGKTALQDFQKGILLSINSLRAMFEDLKSEYNIESILTHRINNNSIEKLFSEIKEKGELVGTPTPLDCLSRMRMIFLTKNKASLRVGKKSNNSKNSEDQYLLGDVLKQPPPKPIDTDIEYLDTNDPAMELCFAVSSLTEEDTMNSNIELNENDEITNLIEWMAKKFKDEFPYLVDYTHNEEYTDHDYIIPDNNVDKLSFEQLYKPSEQWINQASILEKFFTTLHKDTFHEDRKKIIKSFSRKIFKKRNGSINLKIIEKYIEQRTFIRMKYLNKKIIVNEKFKK